MRKGPDRLFPRPPLTATLGRSGGAYAYGKGRGGRSATAPPPLLVHASNDCLVGVNPTCSVPAL